MEVFNLKRKAGLLLLVFSLVISLCGCSKIKKEKVEKVASSDSLYVRKVENLKDDFIMGMDASCVPALENSGVVYYDYQGNQSDPYKVLAQSGINYIRVRVWNDPFDSEGNGYGGGNCDINNAIEIGKRATKYGMKLLVDFHYSDFWADPSKQMVPKAWKDMDIETKAEALYQYTKDCLKQLKDAGIDVGMVQLGNETNGSMCGETKWMNIAYYLMGAGSKACREVFPKALIAVHFANPEKVTNYADYAKKLDYYSIDYDVFASSYYPYWHGTLDNLAEVLSSIAEKYNKKVMVAETSYAYTNDDSDYYGNTISDGGAIVKSYPFTIQGQANSVVDIVDTLVNKTKNAIGIFYWEGTWISVGGNSYEENSIKWEKYGSGWATSYAKEYDRNDAGKYYGGNAVDNQAMFDKNGHPLESLKVFALMKKGNEVESRPDAIEDSYLTVDINGSLSLPTMVNAVMNDNSKAEIPVEWTQLPKEVADDSKRALGTYLVTGTAQGFTANCYVKFIEYNFLTNDSFEQDSNGTIIPTGWDVIKYVNSDELYVEDKSTDSLSGTKHFHFWSANTNTVNFDLEQNCSQLESGKYKYTISIMGGDAGNTNVYSYVKINGEVVASAPLTITSYNDWHSATIENISYKKGDQLIVGIHVECSGSGNGAWGKIDDAMLNSVSE